MASDQIPPRKRAYRVEVSDLPIGESTVCPEEGIPKDEDVLAGELPVVACSSTFDPDCASLTIDTSHAEDGPNGQ